MAYSTSPLAALAQQELYQQLQVESRYAHVHHLADEKFLSDNVIWAFCRADISSYANKVFCDFVTQAGENSEAKISSQTPDRTVIGLPRILTCALAVLAVRK